MTTTIDIGGLRLSCADRGDRSDFAVVFLPGPTDSWLSYATVLDQVPASLRCVAVSQRGHGDSDKPETGYRVEDFAADVPSLLDALGVGRAVLVGHSGSCLTARRVALDHRDRVAGLVLEASPTTLQAHAGLEQLVTDVVATLADPIDPDFARSFVTDTSTAGLDGELVDAMAVELTKVPARVWREMFAALRTYDDLAEIETLVAPTLLVWGDADPIVGRAMQDELVRRLADATLIIYEGVGHAPRWEDPRRFAADVATFSLSVASGPSTL